jgi:hypothetical protein
MENIAQVQESFECFGVPQQPHGDDAASIAANPPGWNRRKWLLGESANLGAEALPSPPLAASIEITVVR